MRREAISQDWKDEVSKCAQITREGGVLLYPADTIWGLGCDASNKDAIQKIADIKERPLGKSFITLVSSWRMLQNVVKDIPPIAEEILENSKESISIVYPSANPSYQHLCSEDGKIAVRLVQEGFAHDLIERLGRAMISTSANASGDVAPREYHEISEELIDQVDRVANPDLDYKLTGSASRVMMLEMNGQIKILR